MKDKIESIGTLWKREKLATLEWEVEFDELLLEDKDPLPGYYDHFEIPSQEKDFLPRWIFAVLRQTGPCDTDHLIDIATHIKKEKAFSFDAVPGHLTLNNEIVPCIRFQLDDYKHLAELIKSFSKHGFEFVSDRKVPAYDSLIKIIKFFDLSFVDDSIYKDNDLPDTHYIIIPKRVDWDTFEKLTISVKNNCSHKIFDAALVSAYDKSGLINMVRIYDRKQHIENIREIRNRYQSEITYLDK
ncbi:MAG: hypothetical protein WBJ84_02160 [Bacteroidales bacterium]